MAGLASPPILHIVENITRPEALRDLRAFYAPGGDGGRFRVHLETTNHRASKFPLSRNG